MESLLPAGQSDSANCRKGKFGGNGPFPWNRSQPLGAEIRKVGRQVCCDLRHGTFQPAAYDYASSRTGDCERVKARGIVEVNGSAAPYGTVNLGHGLLVCLEQGLEYVKKRIRGRLGSPVENNGLVRETKITPGKSLCWVLRVGRLWIKKAI